MARGRSPGYDAQRQAILAAAARLFARSGYVGTSMNQIAEAAGLSKPSLYHYYRDKYAILVEIAEGHVNTLDALVQDVRAQALPPDEAVRRLIERIIGEYADAQDAHRVLTEDVRFLEPEDRARVLGAEKRVVAGFAEAIGAWQPPQAQAGLAKPLTMLLFGMINWMFTWLRPDGTISHGHMGEMVVALFFGGIQAIRAQPSAAEGSTRSPSVRKGTGSGSGAPRKSLGSARRSAPSVKAGVS